MAAPGHPYGDRVGGMAIDALVSEVQLLLVAVEQVPGSLPREGPVGLGDACEHGQEIID